MKKLFLLMMMLMPLCVSAQEGIYLFRNVTFSGNIIALLKSYTPTDGDKTTYPSGTKWYLKNVVIGNDNYVSFWIETPDGRKHEYNTWNGHSVAIIDVKLDGFKNYIVEDDMYSYLSISQVKNDFYILTLCTSDKMME